MISQNKRIAAMLKRGYKLTALEAFRDFGCLRLAARINDLRAQGFPIESRTICVGAERKRVAQYYWAFSGRSGGWKAR